MTILDRLFGNQAPAAPDATPPAGTVQQNKTPSGDSAQQNPTVPNSNTPASDGSHPAFPAQDTSDSSKSTTANFADLWKAPEPTNKTPAADPTVLNLGLDPTKLAARVQQMDFSSAFDPALITKAQQGDASAMSQLLNTAIRTGFEKSVTVSTKMIEQAINQQMTAMKAQLPSTINSQFTASQVRADNPMMSDPAMGPVIDAISQQLMVKNPGKNPTEIKSMLNQFLDGLATSHAQATGKQFVSPDQSQNRGVNPMARQDTDWSTFLG